MRTKLVIANWKMNADKAAVANLLAGYVETINSSALIAVCPPAPYLSQVQEQLSGTAIALGAQNVSQFESGAYTGEASLSMLADFKCQYVLLGHSERRSLFGEQDKDVAEKFIATLKAGLTPVLCIGETQAQRLANETDAVVNRQLDAVIDAAGIAAFADAVIAYEPVWAIGTGDTATPEQAQQVHKLVRDKLAGIDADIAQRVPVLYGGSVNAGNAKELFAMSDIDGGLVGGASLDSVAFAAICAAAG
ncbi:MAG: triose-phosphate isomerase [Pseudomonadales bacterium]